MAGKIVTLRLDDALEGHISSILENLRSQGETGATRSSVVRAILQRELGSDVDTVALRESLRVVHRIVRMASTNAIDELAKLLPAYVERALAETEDAA